MILEILKGTPYWVFILFFVLLALGFNQSRPRTVGSKRVFILPICMIGLSIYGVYSAFSLEMIAFTSWSIGALISVGLGALLFSAKKTVFNEDTQSFSVPGSWVPLLLMMAIFFTKYFVGYSQAVGLPFIESVTFIATIALLYGAFSGLFLARSLSTWRRKKQSLSNKKAVA